MSILNSILNKYLLLFILLILLIIIFLLNNNSESFSDTDENQNQNDIDENQNQNAIDENQNDTINYSQNNIPENTLICPPIDNTTSIVDNNICTYIINSSLSDPNEYNNLEEKINCPYNVWKPKKGYDNNICELNPITKVSLTPAFYFKANKLLGNNPVLYYDFKLHNIKTNYINELISNNFNISTYTSNILSNDYTNGITNFKLNDINCGPLYLDPTLGISFSFWIKTVQNNNKYNGTIFEFSNSIINQKLRFNKNKLLFNGICCNINSNVMNNNRNYNLIFGIYNNITGSKESSSDIKVKLKLKFNTLNNIVWCIDNKGTWKIYSNGKLIKNIEGIIPDNIIRNINYIGKSSMPSVSVFDDIFNEFRVYNKNLSENDIKKIYNSNI